MTTDDDGRLLLCTSGEGTLTAFNTRARKMEGQVNDNIICDAISNTSSTISFWILFRILFNDV